MPSESAQRLIDAGLLNSHIFGGGDSLQDEFRSTGNDVDPAATALRLALNVYDRYDQFFAQFGFTVLRGADLGFDPADQAPGATDQTDRNYFYEGGLYRNNFQEFEDGSTAAFTSAAAVALVVEKPTADGGKEVHLVLRGTDADSGADGEAATGPGQARYYRQLTPLIDQLFEYISNPENGVTDFVVSGQSLGGTMSDLFAIYDGSRFAAIEGLDFQIVALASAGVNPATLALKTDFDPAVAAVNEDGSLTLTTPDFLRQYTHNEDIVYHPERYNFALHNANDPERAPLTNFINSFLLQNQHFDGNLTELDPFFLDQYVLSGPLDTTFLPQHYYNYYEITTAAFGEIQDFVNPAGYGASLLLDGRNPTLVGVSDPNNVNSFTASEAETNDTFLAINQGFGAASVLVLGLSGNDVIRGTSHGDLLSGGDGLDRLVGGAGADVLVGGTGGDLLLGDAGADTLLGGAGRDRLVGGSDADDLQGGADNDKLEGGSGADTLAGGLGNDVMVGGSGGDVFVFDAGRDQIRDFSGIGDLIDVSALVDSIALAALLESTDTIGGRQRLDFGDGNVLTVFGLGNTELTLQDFLTADVILS